MSYDEEAGKNSNEPGPEYARLEGAQGAEVQRQDPDETIELTVDTYTFPVVWRYAVMVAARVHDCNDDKKLTSKSLLMIPLSMGVAGFQMFILIAVVRHSILHTVLHISNTEYAVQLTCCAILFLSLLPDMDGIVTLMTFSPVEFYHRLKGVRGSVDVVWLAWCQLAVVSFTAYGAVAYIQSMQSLPKIVLGTFTIGFVATLDELIMKGILAVFGIRDGSKVNPPFNVSKVPPKRLTLTLTWKLTPKPNKDPHLTDDDKDFADWASAPLKWRLGSVAVMLALMLIPLFEVSFMKYQESPRACNTISNTFKFESIKSEHLCTSAKRAMKLPGISFSKGLCLRNASRYNHHHGPSASNSSQLLHDDTRSLHVCIAEYVAVPIRLLPAALGVHMVLPPFLNICKELQMQDPSTETCDRARAAYDMRPPSWKSLMWIWHNSSWSEMVPCLAETGGVFSAPVAMCRQ